MSGIVNQVGSRSKIVTNSVNIGTTTNLDQGVLTVAGQSTGTRTNLMYLKQRYDSSYGWKFQADNQSTGDLYFQRHEVGTDVSGEVVTFKANGHVGIGTDNPAFCNLEVSAAGGSQPHIGLVPNHTGNAGSRNWQLKTNQTSWGDLVFMVGASNTGTPNDTVVMELRSNGRVHITSIYSVTTGGGANVHVDSAGLLHRSTSSRRYKRNITDFNVKGLSEILNVRTVSFQGAAGQPDEDNTHVGFIAEEIDEAGLSEVVELNDEGVVDSINYQGLTAVMCTAIQELSAKNDALEARILALESV
tara:strand:- start:18 stop:923 length:906 start_codon:yes stop_codon:yes gene_type:complete